MNLTYAALDRLAKRGRLNRALCFKAPLSGDYSDTYVLVIWYLDRKGKERFDVVRSHNTNEPRSYRLLISVEKLIIRWKLKGMYMSLLESSAESNRKQLLSDEDWKIIKDKARLPDLEAA